MEVELALALRQVKAKRVNQKEKGNGTKNEELNMQKG